MRTMIRFAGVALLIATIGAAFAAPASASHQIEDLCVSKTYVLAADGDDCVFLFKHLVVDDEAPLTFYLNVDKGRYYNSPTGSSWVAVPVAGDGSLDVCVDRFGYMDFYDGGCGFGESHHTI